MAKIVYYISPFDHAKKIDLEKSGTIGDVLKELEIQDLSLSVVINGENPDECDLEYELQDEDVIEIHKLVHGEGSASNKQSLATIIQIAALVVVTVLSGGTTSPLLLSAILVASAIISGALMKRAAELNASSGSGEAESNITSNRYSLTSANNEARPGSPWPLVMGKHRLAPDIMGPAYKNYFGQEAIRGAVAPYLDTFIPGVISTAGPDDLDSAWIPMPANFIATDFPKYDIKISPFRYGLLPGELTPAKTTQIINDVKLLYLTSSYPTNMNWKTIGLDSSSYAPLIIYHSDPTDPFYRTVSTMYFIARQFEYNVLRYPGGGPGAVTYEKGLGSLYSGVVDPSLVGISELFYFFTENPFLVNSKPLLRVEPTLDYFYPSTIKLADTVNAAFTKLYNWIVSINSDSGIGLPHYSSIPAQVQYKTVAITSVVKEGIPFSSQVFSYGIGDLTISDRRISANEVLAPNRELTAFSPVNNNAMISTRKNWLIDPIYFPTKPGFPDEQVLFQHDIYVSEKKSLFNVGDTTFIASEGDLNQYNWLFYEGKFSHQFITFNITGYIYGTNGGGIMSNSCLVQVQMKTSIDASWRTIPGGLITVQNDNTKKIIIDFSVYEPEVLEDQKLEIRIRKVTLDSVNNNAGMVCNLDVENVTSLQTQFYLEYPGNYKKILNIPNNLEGVYLTALVNDASQTNKYSALIESKCWVYDFVTLTWSWTFNRNPAFWFLYFARGGYRNIPARNNLTYPYSPTFGWVNYKGHPDNSEIIFGVGLLDSEIDLDKILEWAEFCADNNLTMDMVLKDDTSCADVLDRIANIGRGASTYYNGLLSVVYEDPEQVPTCMFGMGNIKAGTFSVNYQLQEPVRKVVVKYVSNEDWESKTVEALVPYSDPDNLKIADVILEGVTEEAQAQRECNILAARQYFQRRTYSWEVDMEGLIAKRGDLVYLSHDSTQYGYSGRIKNFNIVNGVVLSIETSSIIDESINYITIREPNGDMNNYACHTEGEKIVFDDIYPISKAHYYLDRKEYNYDSLYPKSIPEDFVFISGAQETTGKVVRISQIEASGDYNFKISAFDEDPAMWGYEYDNVLPPESFDDAEIVLSLANIQLTDLGAGLLRINWENVNGDMIQIINETTMLPIEASGSFTFTGGQVTLELTPNTEYTLILKPFAIGTAYKSIEKRVKRWLK